MELALVKLYRPQNTAGQHTQCNGKNYLYILQLNKNV